MKVKAIKGEVFELAPAKKYLIVFDGRVTTQNDARDLMGAMGKEGFKGIGYIVQGGGKLQVISQADDTGIDLPTERPDTNSMSSKAQSLNKLKSENIL